MKRLIIGVCLAATIGVVSHISLSNKISQEYSDMTMANLEALVGPEHNDEEGMEECSRFISTANCYRKDELGRWVWCNLRITEVEKYYKSSCVVVCHHDAVTQCISNCEEI